ncbi:MAG TPA: hypothetical protein V6C88_14425, partial [Chroococcidiopsis sp.]
MSSKGTSSSGSLSLHYGTVSAVDEAIGAAKVLIEDLGIESYWLPIPVRRMAEDQHVDWLDVGDRVSLLLDEKGEQGAILGCYYDQSNPPPIATKDK